MFWIYALIGTAGVVTLVPTVLRALANLETSIVEGVIGFGGSVFAVTGLVGLIFTDNWWLHMLAAAALATSAAVIHPEIVTALRTLHDRDDNTDDATAAIDPTAQITP